MIRNTKAERRSLPDLECACATIRRSARLVTQLYSHEMASVEPSQFALLSALSSHPGATQAPIGRALGLDKTTLSRNLRLLEKNGWIEVAPTDDRRERGYRLTAAGKRILNSTKAGWIRAQRKLRAALKPGEWESMMNVFGRVAAAALIAQESTPNRKGRTA
jgi:DNA-binding MarR family transcriptional regulator